MSARPALSGNLDAKIFREFYYLKEELVSFCKANKLSSLGGKIELSDRIAQYLETGEVQSVKSALRRKVDTSTIYGTSQIEANFVCSEKHRAFFKSKIGKSFSFNIPFQKWLKNNTGKTYSDAIESYHQILKEKKKGKTTIDKQFEYNTYIRDFFAQNKDCSLNDAIECWKYKKSIKGHNRYEASDLQILCHKEKSV